jgi:hypothetical protein
MQNNISQVLVEEYAVLIEPILSEAKTAYGSRNLVSDKHVASREYTRLLTEFYGKGGSLPLLARRLKVAYAGVRRRVVMNDVSVSSFKPKVRIKNQNIAASAQRVINAREKGGDTYHDQLAEEYQAGISLSNLAKELGLSSAAPLYYGVQRSLQRNKK